MTVTVWSFFALIRLPPTDDQGVIFSPTLRGNTRAQFLLRVADITSLVTITTRTAHPFLILLLLNKGHTVILDSSTRALQSCRSIPPLHPRWPQHLGQHCSLSSTLPLQDAAPLCSSRALPGVALWAVAQVHRCNRRRRRRPATPSARSQCRPARDGSPPQHCDCPQRLRPRCSHSQPTHLPRHRLRTLLHLSLLPRLPRLACLDRLNRSTPRLPA